MQTFHSGIKLILLFLFMLGCSSEIKKETKPMDISSVRLITLDPGHFHAALLQKSMYDGIDSTVYVFAPEGSEVKSHMTLIDKYNTRKDNPTSWKQHVYTGDDYFEKLLNTHNNLLAGHTGVVVIAGNNRMKADYIKKTVDAGLNVLADKPMAINRAGFDSLQQAFLAAEKNKVLLYDIMTERYNITNLLQKAFLHLPDVFGELTQGTLEHPAIEFESVHYFYKEVSGFPLVRPAWFFDVDQQGEGLVDVTTHIIDLIQWECFPEAVLDYRKDIQVISAKHWATQLTPSEFSLVTKDAAYPDFLKKDIRDSLLNVFANGEMNYTLNDIHSQVKVNWKYKAPKGAGDTYYSVLRGTKTNLVIRQDKEQEYNATLYLEPANKNDMTVWRMTVENSMDIIQKSYPGVTLKTSKYGFEVIIPKDLKVDPEEQFSLVVKKYLEYLREGRMPEWEKSNMLCKYYITTQALEKATSKKN